MNLLQDKASRPRNWILESMLVACFWCFPLGIAAFVFAIRGRQKWKAGDLADAVRDIAKAKYYTILGFWIGIAWMAIIMIILLLMARI